MQIIRESRTWETDCGQRITVSIDSNEKIRFETWTKGYKAYCLHTEKTISRDQIESYLDDCDLDNGQFNIFEILKFIDESEAYGY